METGDKVVVRREGKDTVSWERNGKEVCKAKIPATILGKVLYPMVWITSS